MGLDKKFDIVIIGSGLGGLACGSILSQRGYQVCVLEKHHQIGGCLQDFKRKHVLFDTGMHYIGSYGDGQILNTLFRYFDIYDKVEAKKLNEDGFDIFHVGGKDFSIPQGIDRFKAKLKLKFPDEIPAIDKYFETVLDIYESVDIVNLRDVSLQEFGDKKGLDQNVYDFVSSLTNNEELRNVLCLTNSLYGGKKESASLFVHAIINVFYLNSAWKLAKGGGQIAKAFRQVIEANGGEVHVNSEVTKLVCHEGYVKELFLKDQTIIKADRFISNIDPLTTTGMLEGANIRNAFINRLKRQEQTTSCFSLYVILKEKTLAYQNSNIYYYNSDSVWALDEYRAEDWPQGYMLYLNESADNKGFAESLIVLSPMDFNEMEPWFDTSIEKRGDAYRKMKTAKAEKLIALLKKRYNNINDCIDTYYTSSPLTYRDYTGVREGAMYGNLTDSRNPFASQVFPKTRLKNLFLTGQNVNMHGILGVSMGAILTCGEMEGINNIMNDLRSHKKIN